MGEVIWQLPGGLAAENEEIEEAGLRELLEETGYAPHIVTAETIRYLGAVLGQSGVWRWTEPCICSMGTPIC